LVFVTFDWKAFKSYAENCRVGTIQQRTTCDGEEIRVLTGRFGFRREFKNNNGKIENQELLTEIVVFCELHGFIQVEGSVPDEQFHTQGA